MKVKKPLSYFYFQIPKKLYKSFYIAVIVILAFATCDLAFLNGNRSYQYSLVDADGNPVLSTIPDEEFFYINLKSAYYTGDSNTFDPLDFELYAMDDGPGTDCKISVNEESGTEDLFCMFDVMEGDLWYHEINLEYNAPPGMCAYLGFLPHWHYNQEVGYGPKFVRKDPGEGEAKDSYIGYNDSRIICKKRTRSRGTENWGDWGKWHDPESSDYHCGNEEDKDSATTPQWDHTKRPEDGCWKKGRNDNKPTQYETPDTDTPPSARTLDDQKADKEYRCVHNLTNKIGGTESDVKQVCPFDKSHIEKAGLSNCCLGEYTLIDSKTQATEKKEWGGDVKNCIGGLARMNWDSFKKGYPVTLIEESGSKGLKKDYKLYQLDDKVEGRYSFPTANFFKDIEEDKATVLPDFYYSTGLCGVSNNDRLYYPSCTNKADCEKSHTCNNGTAGEWENLVGHPFITWSCLDNAREAKHRIHLLIREWNTQEEFNSFKESEGSRGDPDTGGLEGSECDYYEKTDIVFGNCNDLADADDFGAAGYPEIKYE